MTNISVNYSVPCLHDELLKVDLRFQLGEDKTIVSSKIVVLPRIEGICMLILVFSLFFSFSWVYLSFNFLH